MLREAIKILFANTRAPAKDTPMFYDIPGTGHVLVRTGRGMFAITHVMRRYVVYSVTGYSRQSITRTFRISEIRNR